MNKFFSIFLLIALAAVSCQKETVESGSDSGIGFFTLLTRGNAVVNPADVAAAGGFRVWGYKHSGNWPAAVSSTIFNGTYVTSDDNGATWSYSGAYGVWPARDNVSFFAFAPAGIAGSGIDDSQAVPVVGFSVDNDPASQGDLLIAHQVLNRRGPDPVEVIFEHALSRISFSARKTIETVGDVYVASLELRNIYYTGSAPLLTPVSWTVNPATTQYTLSTTNGLLADTAPSLTTSWQTISTSDGIMFLMPQTLAPTAELVITFWYSGPLTSREFTSTINLSEVFPAWETGTPYNYQLLFDGEVVVVIGATLQSITSGDWGQY